MKWIEFDYYYFNLKLNPYESEFFVMMNDNIHVAKWHSDSYTLSVKPLNGIMDNNELPLHLTTTDQLQEIKKAFFAQKPQFKNLDHSFDCPANCECQYLQNQINKESPFTVKNTEACEGNFKPHYVKTRELGYRIATDGEKVYFETEVLKEVAPQCQGCGMAKCKNSDK